MGSVGVRLYGEMEVRGVWGWSVCACGRGGQ